IQRDDGTRYLARRPSRITHEMLLRRNVVGNQVLARTADILECGGFDESLSASQDYDLWIRLSARVSPGVGLPTPLQIVHAQSSRNRVSNSPQRRRSIWSVYRKHASRMTREQKKSHIFNLIRTTNRKLSIRTAFVLWSSEDSLRILA